MPANKALSSVSSSLTKATENLEREFGGRESVIEALRHLPEENKFRILADALSDPDNDQTSIARVCDSLGIKPQSFFLIYRDARAAKALAESMDVVYNGLPRVAGTAMKYGQEHHQLCPCCFGMGQVEKEKKKEGEGEELELENCKRCRATGKILYVPDNERVKTALEIGGMMKKGPQTQIQVDQRKSVNVFHSGALRDFLSATDKALRIDRQKPIDLQAEEVQEEESA